MGSWSSGRVLTLAAVALTLPDMVRAQLPAGGLSGEIGDAATGAPLGEVRVTASGPALAAPRSAVTDRDGRFAIEALPPGLYRLEATAEGFLAEARDGLEVKPGTTLRVRLALTPDTVVHEEVVVTGSHIKRRDLTTPAPVTVITREQIQQDARLTLGDVLQALPEQGNALNRQFNNGGDGSTRVSLRSLGDYRTLVLLNGRRLVASGNGADRSPDLGTIPASAIERIEILKDGASPIYGSEAMGGVINVITRRRWSGLEVGVVGGSSQRGDGVTGGADLAFGRTSDDTSLLLSASYLQLGSAMAGDRPWSAKPYGWDFATGTKTVSGSPVGPSSTVVISPTEVGIPNGNQLWNDLVAAYPDQRRFIHDPSAPLGWRPWNGTALPEDGGDGYNFQPSNYLVTPAWLTSVLASGETRVPGAGHLSFELGYSHRRSAQMLAPLPLLLAQNVGSPASADGIYNPFGRDFGQIWRRVVETENRRFEQEVDQFRLVVALDGRTPEAWGPVGGLAWELSANLGRSQATQLVNGFLSGRMLASAVGPSFIDPGPNGVVETAPGQAPQGDDVARCGTPTAPIAGCVPVNLFGGPGSITPAMLNQLTYTGQTRGSDQLVSLQANASGQSTILGQGHAIGLAFGYEYRAVAGEFIPDTLSMSGDRLDVQQAPTKGSADVHEVYGEITVPLLTGAPLADLVEAMAAARVFKHEGFSADWTWKLGARWRLLPDLTLRGTASTAYRVPSVSELFNGRTLSDTDFTSDPCAVLDPALNPSATPTRIAHCTAAGVPSGGTGAFTSVPAPVVGNRDLRPELSRAFTAGVIVEPRFASGLTITADLWGVQVSRAINLPGGGLVLDSCYPTAEGAVPALCNLVDRDPATGQLRGVTNQYLNAGWERASGIDFAVLQSIPTSLGRFDLSLQGTWLASHDIQAPDGTTVHARGNYDAFLISLTAMSGLNPALVANLGATWSLGGARVGAMAHFISASKECGVLDPDTGETVPSACSFEHQYTHRIDSWVGVDASAEYTLRTAAGRTRIWLGVQDLLDRPPPFVSTNSSYGAYMTDPSAFSALGRSFQVRLSQSF